MQKQEEENDFIAGVGCDSEKLYSEFIKLLASFGDELDTSQMVLSIRESKLSETEKLAVAVLCGRFSGTLSAVDNIRGAVNFLEAVAQEVLVVQK